MIHQTKKSSGLKQFAKANSSPNQNDLEQSKFLKEHLLSEIFFKKKKSLGQNFLRSGKVLNKMCEIGEVVKKDTVLEIGPGKGVLTVKLLEKVHRVIAIEKDRELVRFLEKKFSEEIEAGKLILIENDILKFDISKISNLFHYKIIANIPYNITGLILKKFLTLELQPEKMVLLVQKEVAERIVARDGKESILSLSIKAYGTPKYIMKVDKKYFSPSPQVDSAVLLIDQISKKNFKNVCEEKIFFDIVKAGFAHKRKILKKNLEIMEIKKDQINKIFNVLKIDKKIRAEKLSTYLWLQISKQLSTKN